MSGDLVERLRALARAKHDDLSVANEAADLIEAQAAEIERLRNEADKYCAWWREERDKRIALRARVREVVGGMLSHSCVADAGSDCKFEEDEAADRAA